MALGVDVEMSRSSSSAITLVVTTLVNLMDMECWEVVGFVGLDL